MANTYSQVYVQCVFAVKYRDAIIRQEWRQTLLGLIGNRINETGCKTIIVNGVEDHVHCFVGLKPNLSISELMKAVKAKWSKYINDDQLVKRWFEWQEGYGVFSYGHSQLEKFEIPYDKRYIFADLTWNAPSLRLSIIDLLSHWMD